MVDKWDQLRSLAEEETERRNLPAAEKSWRAALKAAESFDENDKRLALTLEGLAEVLWHQGKFREATTCCERLLALYEKVLGRKSYDVGVISNNLAMLFHVREEFKKAEEHYRKALSIKSDYLGANHPEVVKLTGNFTNLLKAQGRDSEAELLKSGAQMITAKSWTKTSPEQANEQENPKLDTKEVASTAPKSEATSNGTREATTKKKVQTESPPPAPPLEGQKTDVNPVASAIEKWEILREIAEKAASEKKYNEAEAVWYATIKFFEPYGADDQRRLAYSLDGLADCLCALGKLQDAEPYYRRAIDIKEKNLGKDHLVVAKSLNNLARVFYQMSRLADAEPLAKRCVEIYERIFGSEHPDYASALHNLGTLYHIQLRFKDAEPLYWKALKIRQRTLGPDHPESIGLSRSLANLLRSTGRKGEAKNVHESESSIITGSWRVLDIPEDAQLTSG